MANYHPLLVIELVVIILVILFQLFHSVRVYRNIRKFSRIFMSFLYVKNGMIERKFLKDPDSLPSNVIYPEGDDTARCRDDQFAAIALTETGGDNETILRIRNAINTYLVNNYGAAVNFSIIRDIIDRETDARDEEITQSLPTPLYLGLAATMVGIIFGLMAMPDIDGSNFTEGVNRLIDGVRLAMTASLTGLLCTTMLSSFFYKRAKKQTLLLKNAQLSHLQSKLLPELVKAEDTGLSGLKASLDHFTREATVITDNVHQSAMQTGANLQVQENIIARLERLNMTRVTRANMELFSRLESNMEAFQNFSRYLSVMEEIASNLKEFASRTLQIDRISGQIETNLSESRELIRFLNAHFEKIDRAGSAALMAVDLSDSHFRESVELLKEKTRAGIETLFTLSDKTESDLRTIFDQITERISEATGKHIEEFIAAYSKAVPHFNQLEYLQPIRENLSSLSDTLASQSEKMNQSVQSLLAGLAEKFSYLPGNQPIESLESALRELTTRLPEKESSGNSGRKHWINRLETVLRIGAWAGILAVCAVIILSYLKKG